jgi:DNA-binding protein YbaB
MSDLEKMETMMQEMNGKMQAMQEFIKEQSLEITALKKGSKGAMTATESVDF